MFALLTTIHVLVAGILILIILIQSARGTDIAAAFGGMGSQAAFGPRGTTTFLAKATVALAIVFMVTSLSLAILSNRLRGEGGESVLSDQPPATESQPATPTPAPTAPGIQVQPVPAPAPAAPSGGAETTPATPPSGP